MHKALTLSITLTIVMAFAVIGCNNANDVLSDLGIIPEVNNGNDTVAAAEEPAPERMELFMRLEPTPPPVLAELPTQFRVTGSNKIMQVHPESLNITDSAAQAIEAKRNGGGLNLALDTSPCPVTQLLLAGKVVDPLCTYFGSATFPSGCEQDYLTDPGFDSVGCTLTASWNRTPGQTFWIDWVLNNNMRATDITINSTLIEDFYGWNLTGYHGFNTACFYFMRDETFTTSIGQNSAGTGNPSCWNDMFSVTLIVDNSTTSPGGPNPPTLDGTQVIYVGAADGSMVYDSTYEDITASWTGAQYERLYPDMTTNQSFEVAVHTPSVPIPALMETVIPVKVRVVRTDPYGGACDVTTELTYLGDFTIGAAYWEVFRVEGINADCTITQLGDTRTAPLNTP